MTLTRREVSELLSRNGIRPSRALGQNFVVDPNTVRRIARLAAVGPGDRVVEIGAGLGSLTTALAETGADIVAVELDRYLAPVLRSVVEPLGVRVVEGDALHLDWDVVLGRGWGDDAGRPPVGMGPPPGGGGRGWGPGREDDTGRPPVGMGPPPGGGGRGWGPGREDDAGRPPVGMGPPPGGGGRGWGPGRGDEHWILVANLPYNVATPLVLTLLERAPMISRMLVMVQREAGERLAAGPGHPAYGAVSVKVAYRARAKVVGRVPATVFVPQPKVASVLVSVERLPAPAVTVDEKRFLALVEAGFAHRRKMLRGALASLVDEAVFAAAGVRPEARAEELDVETWGRLTACSASGPSPS